MSTKLNDRVGEVHSMTNELAAIIKHQLNQITKTCMNCSNFNEPLEECSLFKARPPAKIIAYGCEKHEDQIPF